MSSPPLGLIMVVRARAPRIRALFRTIVFSRWSQQWLFWVAEQWWGLSWEGTLKTPKPYSARSGCGQSEKFPLMTPQLLDEDFVLRGLEGTGKYPGFDAASTQSGPERSVYKKRDDTKSESFHMCVSPLLTRGVGISKKLHGQMRPSLIWYRNRIFWIITPKNSPLSWSRPWEALPLPLSPASCA